MTATASLDALIALGLAWRGDWADFDGRVLRDQLYSWRVLFEKSPDDADAARAWAESWDVCIEHQSFREWCREMHT